MPEHVTITRHEWRAVALFAGLVMALTLVPYVVGWLSGGDDWMFGGFVFGVDDGYSYLAKMRLGAQGDWLFTLRYTAEPHDGALLFLPYIALGQLVGALIGPDSPHLTSALIVAFHGARMIFGFALILASYRFAAVFLADRGARRLALVLITLAGGLGWLVMLLAGDDWLGSLPPDLYIPEGYSFLVIYGLPHLALARTAMLIGWLLLFRALGRDQGWGRDAGLAGLCWAVMGLSVPFYVAVVYVLLGMWGLAAWARQRAFPWELFRRAATAALVALPVLAYSGIVFVTNDVFREWSGQNRLPAPHPLQYVVGYIVLALPAAFAVRAFWRQGDSDRDLPRLLIPTWAITALLIVYLPINVQRRLAEGVIVPLSILAAAGLYATFTNRARRRLAQGIVLGLTLPTTLLLIAGGLFGARTLERPVFRPAAELRALAAIDHQRPPGTVLLCDRETGNAAPAWADLIAYVGHGPETINTDAKETLVEQFYAGTLDPAARRALLDTVDVIFYGPLERAHGTAVEQDAALRLLPGFDASDPYRAYEVIP